MVAPGAIADGSFCWTWEPLELWNQLLTYICLHVYIWNTYFFYSILGIRLYIHGVFVPERDLSPSCSKRCHSSASELRIHSDRLTRTDGTWTIGAIWCNTSTIGESCANGHIKNCPLFKIFKKCSGARFEKKRYTQYTVGWQTDINWHQKSQTRHASGSKASVNFSNKSTASCQRLPLSKALAQALKLTVLLFAIGDTFHGSCMWKYGMLGQPVGGCLAGKDLRQVWVQAVSTDQRAPDRIAPKFHENLEFACHKSPITMYIVFLSYLHTLYGCVCSLKSYHKISLHIHVKAKYEQN